MNEAELKDRTQQFAFRIINVVNALPANKVAATIGIQLLRSGTSVGANYRAACRAKSVADMLAKLAIVEEEADETLYWLELLIKSNLVPAEKLIPLMQENNELIAIIVSSIKTLRSKRSNKSS